MVEKCMVKGIENRAKRKIGSKKEVKRKEKV